MQTDAEVIAKIVRQVRDGELPTGSLSTMPGGWGDEDAFCVVCGRSIGTSQVLYEIVYDEGGAKGTLTAHLHCHDLWRQALRKHALTSLRL